MHASVSNEDPINEFVPAASAQPLAVFVFFSPSSAGRYAEIKHRAEGLARLFPSQKKKKNVREPKLYIGHETKILVTKSILSLRRSRSHVRPVFSLQSLEPDNN
jgi:hypothetical protein